MALFAITFRVHEDATYEERYESLVDAIKGLAEGNGRYWDEPTSFFLITSSQTASNLAAGIQNLSALSQITDLVLIINLSERQYAILGAYADSDFHTLMKQR